jgi:putative cardiolipin synthase
MLAFTAFYLSSTCTSLPTDYERTVSHAISNPEDTEVGGMFEKAASKHDGKSGFALIPNNHQAFINRVGLAEFAEKSLDIQYYIWADDTIGNLLAERILRAADRGVRVRFLIDDLNFQKRDSLAAGFSAHPNIEVRIFNPALHRSLRAVEMAASFNRLNKRMHNKVMVMDNACAIIGGRNIADDYFGMHPESNKRDLDIAASGPVVREISTTFDEFWNSKAAVPIEILIKKDTTLSDLAHSSKKLRQPLSPDDLPFPIDEDIEILRKRVEHIANNMVWAEGKVLYDSVQSMKHNGQGPTVNAQLRQALRNAKNSVLVESAYFVMRDEGVDLAKYYQKKGVKVRVLTNSLASNDVIAAQAGYKHKADDLIRHGVEIYELRPDAEDVLKETMIGHKGTSGLHTKTLVIDQRLSFVGSYNFDPRSADINSEIGLFVDSPEFAAQICSFLDRGVLPRNAYHLTLDQRGKRQWKTIVDGKEQVWHVDPNTSLFQRLKAEFLGLLPIDDQL